MSFELGFILKTFAFGFQMLDFVSCVIYQKSTIAIRNEFRLVISTLKRLITNHYSLITV